MISFFFVFSFITLYIFYPIFIAKEIIISYGIHPFDICSENPELWKMLKITYIVCFIFSNFILSHTIYTRFLMKFTFFQTKSSIKRNDIPCFIPTINSLHLLIGMDDLHHKIYIPETGLYQNFLITGTIGSGKTSSAMYPFTKQLLAFNQKNPKKKIGMLILDVKGNFYQQVKKYAKQYQLEQDLIILELKSNIHYNPLHKPNLKPQVLILLA